MMLSAIPAGRLDAVLAEFAAGLDGPAAAALARIAAAGSAAIPPRDEEADRCRAVALASAFGIPTLDEAPAAGFSWDGSRIRVRSEASVVLHEVAHWLLSPPERRRLPDFGLGAGPESGWRSAADAAACVTEAEREREESLASLLGILLEVELGLPALAAFLEQNWLEGYHRAAAAGHFATCLALLQERRLVDGAGRALMPLPAAVTFGTA